MLRRLNQIWKEDELNVRVLAIIGDPAGIPMTRRLCETKPGHAFGHKSRLILIPFEI
jgi:hypothetical protein